MQRKLPVPDEMRWRIAATVAAEIPLLYGKVFREIAGDQYDRLEQQIWVALAHSAREMAWTYSLPAGDSRELTSTLEILNLLFFGPEFKSEQISFEHDRSVLLIHKCPFLLRQQELSGPRCIQPLPCLLYRACRGIESLVHPPVRPGDVPGGPELRDEDRDKKGC